MCFASVCSEGKQQRCLAAGWGMRENRKCDLGNNIWIRRRDSQSNGCFGLCNWNIESLTAPFVKGLVHPNYRETFSHVTRAVAAQIVWVLFSQISEISVSENNAPAPKPGRWILFMVLKIFQTFATLQKHCPCYWFTDLTVNHFSKCFFFFFFFWQKVVLTKTACIVGLE